MTYRLGVRSTDDEVAGIANLHVLAVLWLACAFGAKNFTLHRQHSSATLLMSMGLKMLKLSWPVMIVLSGASTECSWLYSDSYPQAKTDHQTDPELIIVKLPTPFDRSVTPFATSHSKLNPEGTDS